MANDSCPFRLAVIDFKNMSSLTAEQKADLTCLKSDDCYFWDPVRLDCYLVLR